jgi:hypothetical protein
MHKKFPPWKYAGMELGELRGSNSLWKVLPLKRITCLLEQPMFALLSAKENLTRQWPSREQPSTGLQDQNSLPKIPYFSQLRRSKTIKGSLLKKK